MLNLATNESNAAITWVLWLVLVGATLVSVLLIHKRLRSGPSGVPKDATATNESSDSLPQHDTVILQGNRRELRGVLAACRSALIAVATFSGISNVLMLTGAIFMLEVYDRVLPSRSVTTLIGLAIIAAVLFTAQGILDFIRGRLLSRTGAAIDEQLSGRAFQVLSQLPLRGGARSQSEHPLRDLDSIRSFFASSAPSTLFDLPWIPLYLIIIFAFHPLLGYVALGGAILLAALTVIMELRTRGPVHDANAAANKRNTIAEASRRNAESVRAMGMGAALNARWQQANRAYLESSQQSSDVAGAFGSVSRTLRFMLQSAILAAGAWLVIQGQTTAGIIIAGSILFGRALAPVDQAIANHRNFVAARQSWKRLSTLLEQNPAAKAAMDLPAPQQWFEVQNLSLAAPSTDKQIVEDVSFALKAGSVLGIIGPSGSGKSSLVRGLAGAWPAIRGKVQLDGASLEQWPEYSIGQHIGYLPQDVELFAGSIAENISRFSSEAKPTDIIEAAQAAGAHDLIVSFPEGYMTQIGEQGAMLSAGQRQRIALARALYGRPFVVIMDEPNSNLDALGDKALFDAILGIKERGGIAIIVAHRKEVLTAAEYLLVMQNGRIRPATVDDMATPLGQPERSRKPRIIRLGDKNSTKTDGSESLSAPLGRAPQIEFRLIRTEQNIDKGSAAPSDDSSLTGSDMNLPPVQSVGQMK